jgi:nicotinate dehydrogenase subunit B
MMDALATPRLSRRSVLAGSGALVVSFSMLSRALAQESPAPAAAEPPELPGSLSDAPSLDAWIRIDAAGAISVFTGKAELGQGMKTALLQVAAEELEVEPGQITLVTADTALTPDEGLPPAARPCRTAARRSATRRRRHARS